MDTAIALSLLGSDWDLGSPIVDHTQEEWELVRWWDSRPKPSWDDLTLAWASRPAEADYPIGEVDKFITEYPTLSWVLLEKLNL